MGLEDDMAELSAREVADIFGVSTSTVAFWRTKKGLAGIEPKRKWRRAGYRYTIAAVAAFAREIEDNETIDQLNAWYAARNLQVAS